MSESKSLEELSEQAAVDKNLYFNMNKTYTDDDGVEQYGVWEEGWRDKTDHTIHFEEEAPSAAAAEHTDAAQNRANELGVNIAEVQGTGQNGRVTVNDVEAHAANTQAQAQQQ